jgi:hypothetical protein
VLAFIGWQHEREHKQFVEIQKKLNERGIVDPFVKTTKKEK